ncbi:MAG TPA: hypothetical protein VFE33_35065 [Thermoanaerobaculia bacterium]|nr:hypothetical protein [Thermoanaerobaculia bacterium]
MRQNSRPTPSPALLVAGLLAAVLAITPAAVQAAAHPGPLPIVIARLLPLGTVVTVEGSVTVPSGDFASSFFDEGFAVQDRTGGIYVSSADNFGLLLRQEARVTGTLMDSGGLLILVPSGAGDVTVRGLGDRVDPLRVFTGGIGELTEGRIVQVTGRITQPIGNDLPFGYKVFVNDGTGEIRVFVNLGTGIDVSGLAQGQRITVIGFSGQFIDYEIDPRFPSDIRVQH